jgi:epoxyqueuosine reductase
MVPDELKKQLDLQVQAVGLQGVGIVPATVEVNRAYYLEWINQGKHGDMRWLERNNDRRLYPQETFKEAKSILCFGLNYYQEDPERPFNIAKYALGSDYHQVLMDKLEGICSWLVQFGSKHKAYVDTGPILEKPLAAASGLGWQGKNTLLIHRKYGTWLFLGFIFTSLEFPASLPEADHCGTCTRCIKACPTGAITAPYQLDSRKCIAYLTIEHKGAIPLEYRKAIGNRVYGCDICLEVCPWNRWAQKTKEAQFAPIALPSLTETLEWTETNFKNYFKDSPIKRLKLTRWLRNVCIVLGNTGTQEDLEALERLTHHPDAIVAEQAQWAVEEITTRATLINP